MLGFCTLDFRDSGLPARFRTPHKMESLGLPTYFATPKQALQNHQNRGGGGGFRGGGGGRGRGRVGLAISRACSASDLAFLEIK